MWIIHIQTNKELLIRTLDVLERELSELRTNPFTLSEFDDEYSRMKGLLSLAADESEYRQKRMARQYLAYGSLCSLDRELAELATISYDEVVHASLAIAATQWSHFIYGALDARVLKKRGYLVYAE